MPPAVRTRIRPAVEPNRRRAAGAEVRGAATWTAALRTGAGRRKNEELSTILRLRYKNIYYSTHSTDLRANGPRTPGWASTKWWPYLTTAHGVAGLAAAGSSATRNRGATVGGGPRFRVAGSGEPVYGAGRAGAAPGAYREGAKATNESTMRQGRSETAVVSCQEFKRPP